MPFHEEVLSIAISGTLQVFGFQNLFIGKTLKSTTGLNRGIISYWTTSRRGMFRSERIQEYSEVGKLQVTEEKQTK